MLQGLFGDSLPYYDSPMWHPFQFAFESNLRIWTLKKSQWFRCSFETCSCSELIIKLWMHMHDQTGAMNFWFCFLLFCPDTQGKQSPLTGKWGQIVTKSGYIKEAKSLIHVISDHILALQRKFSFKNVVDKYKIQYQTNINQINRKKNINSPILYLSVFVLWVERCTVLSRVIIKIYVL